MKTLSNIRAGKRAQLVASVKAQTADGTRAYYVVSNAKEAKDVRRLLGTPAPKNIKVVVAKKRVLTRKEKLAEAEFWRDVDSESLKSFTSGRLAEPYKDR
jgi:hypothetical protein